MHSQRATAGPGSHLRKQEESPSPRPHQGLGPVNKLLTDHLREMTPFERGLSRIHYYYGWWEKTLSHFPFHVPQLPTRSPQPVGGGWMPPPPNAPALMRAPRPTREHVSHSCAARQAQRTHDISAASAGMIINHFCCNNAVKDVIAV